MPNAPMVDLLEQARDGRYAVGYFESWDLYSLEATIAAAEQAQSPVIIGVGGLSSNHDWLCRRGIQTYGEISRHLAEQASVPVATLFNESNSLEEASAGIGCGWNALMMHTQGWPGDRLIADTAALVEVAHAAGIAVEGEIGGLAEMRHGALHDEDALLTSPDAAEDFVAKTSVDCLAVSVGNVHFVVDNYTPRIRVDLIEEIGRRITVPLVLHGGSGTPDDQVQTAIAAGIAKINVGTRLKQVFGAAVTSAGKTVADPNRTWGSRLPGDVLLAGAAALTEEIIRLMKVYGSAGKAA